MSPINVWLCLCQRGSWTSSLLQKVTIMVTSHALDPPTYLEPVTEIQNNDVITMDLERWGDVCI